MTTLFTGTTIGFMNGTTWIQADKTNPQFDAIVELVSQGRLDEAEAKVSLRSIVAELTRESSLELKGNSLTFNGETVHGVLGERIIEMVRLGFDVRPLELFLGNLMENPSKRAVDELYGFLEVSELPITDDGHFLAYKSVRSDFTDHHTGSMDNSVGSIVEMERNKVDEDKDRTCSQGLHFAAHEYASTFYGSGNMVILKINPKDVVAIPSDYKNQKGRACRYEIVDSVATEDTSLIGATVIAQPKEDKFKVGSKVRLSARGREEYDNFDNNPHDSIGTVASITSTLYSIHVQWDGYLNVYKTDELEIVTENEEPYDVGTRVTMTLKAQDDYADDESNPMGTEGVVTHNTFYGSDPSGLFYGVKWDNGTRNSYTLRDLEPVKCGDTPALNFDDESIWDYAYGHYEFIGDAYEFPTSSDICYLLENSTTDKLYVNYSFVQYDEAHENLIFRKIGTDYDCSYCTIANIDDWYIGTSESRILNAKMNNA